MLNQKKIGRYEVVSVMGQGAMGTVYKALDPVIERVVAIKTINLELSSEERTEFEARFYREAKSAGRLNHPGIVTIYDVGETDNAAYIAMEYVEGESLREVLDSGVVLPLKRICQIAAHVANALNYAHENGVVHRDIKPANIMISRTRDVKIMDFGIALIPSGSRTQAGTVLGSPKYMAPEQLAGKPTDGRADIFSLGVMFHEMLTGTTPFNGDNLSTIMFKILNEEPSPPSMLNAHVPKAFDRIVAKALAKRPEDRYQTAREFARELRNYEMLVSGENSQLATDDAETRLAKKPVLGTARRAASSADPLDVKTEVLLPPARGTESARRHPAAARARPARYIALAAMPVLAFAIYALWQSRSQPQPQEHPGMLVKALGDSSSSGLQPADRQYALPTARSGQSAVTHQSPVGAETGKASLSFAVTPWGEIFIDGKKAGISPPLTQLELQPGKHSVEIRNGTFVSHRVSVNLASEQTLKIKHKFK